MAEVALLKSVPHLFSAPSKQIWTDYDDKADVLCLSVDQPQQASSSVVEEAIIYHYCDEERVGMTVLNAAAKFGEPNASQ